MGHFSFNDPRLFYYTVDLNPYSLSSRFLHVTVDCITHYSISWCYSLFNIIYFETKPVSSFNTLGTIYFKWCTAFHCWAQEYRILRERICDFYFYREQIFNGTKTFSRCTHHMKESLNQEFDRLILLLISFDILTKYLSYFITLKLSFNKFTELHVQSKQAILTRASFSSFLPQSFILFWI